MLYNSSTPTHSPTQSLEWHVWSSSSGNNCHAVQRSLSSGASVYECIMGFLSCPISSAKSAHAISFDYWPLESVISFRRITLEWHVWPGRRSKYNTSLTLNNIRYTLRVKWSNLGKGVAPYLKLWCSSYSKGSLLVANFTYLFWNISRSVSPLYILMFLEFPNSDPGVEYFEWRHECCHGYHHWPTNLSWNPVQDCFLLHNTITPSLGL